MHPVLAEQCLQLGGARQEITIPVSVPAAGLLHVVVREHGISVAAEIGADAAGSRVTSPILRWGMMSLARDANHSGTASIRLLSVDSSEAVGDVCLSAQIIRPASAALARAARLSFAAGSATFRRSWQEAFDDYLAAARLYDALRIGAASANARTAMAELAHRYLRRDRDSAALLGAVLFAPAPHHPEILAERAMLLAKTLVEDPGASAERDRRLHELLDESSALFASSPRGSRELPWIKILEGFQTYRNQDFPASRRLFEAAASECEELHDSECLAGARQNLAAIAEDEQNYPEALANYEAALRAVDESRSPMLAADISDNLGRLEGRIGLIRRGEEADQSAMQLYARLGDCDGARRATSTLGEMLARIGSIGEATVYLNEATTLECRELLPRLANAPSEGASSRTDAPRSLPEISAWSSSARMRVCVSRPPFRDLTVEGDVAVFHALLATSEIARLDNRPADAVRCLELAKSFAATDVRSQIRLANARGQLMLRAGAARTASTAFKAALRLSDKSGLVDSSEYRGAALLGLGEAELQAMRLQQARTDVNAALHLSSSRADVSRIVDALRLEAAIDRASGRSTDAQRLLSSAIRLIEQVPTGELDPETRAMYLATQHAVYAELTDLLADDAAQAGLSGERLSWSALAVADEGHARSLRYALDQATLDRLSIRRGGATQDYRQLMSSIVGVSRADDAAQTGRLLDSIERLSVSEPRQFAFDQRDLDRTLQAMHATLVEYAAGPRSLYAFVVDEHHLQVVKLGSLETIDGAAGELIAQLRSFESDPNAIRAAARRLAALVLWPITPYIHNVRVLLVPEDALHTIPFAVMPWSSSDSMDLMIRHAEISILPSALYLERQSSDSRENRAAGPFVLIGDPVLRSTVWRRDCAERGASGGSPWSPFEWMKALPSLPGTRDEVLSVAGLARQFRAEATVLTLLGCAATPDALRADAPAAALLHIATHGLVDARRPRLSALVLTPDSNPADDGAVELLDILGMKLRAHLVVLSACDTSGGRLLPGEGVLGLSQAFLQSGAKSVVASYWRVADGTTAGFMKDFYRYLLVDRLPAAAALRRAQLDQAAQSDYSWAAFALYGHPDAKL